MGDTRNSASARIPSAIVLLLLSGILSCKHSAKPQPGPNQVHVGNLLEVAAAPGILAVKAELFGQTFYLGSLAFVLDNQTVALVPLVAVGTKLTFDPTGMTPRTVEVVAGPATGAPGVATLAFLDMLGSLPSKVTTNDANAQSALTLLGQTAAGLRDEVMLAQSKGLTIGSFAGAPLVLDATALALFDAALAGSNEPVVPLFAGSSVVPQLGGAGSFATQPLTKTADPPNPEKAMWGLWAVAIASPFVVWGGGALIGVGGPAAVAFYEGPFRAVIAVVALGPLLAALVNDAANGERTASDPVLEKEFAILQSLSSNPNEKALWSGALDVVKDWLANGPDYYLVDQVAQTTTSIFPPLYCVPPCSTGLRCTDYSKHTCACDAFSCPGGRFCSGDGRCLGEVGDQCSGGADCKSRVCVDGSCKPAGTGCGACPPPSYCNNEGCCDPSTSCFGFVGALCGQDDGCGMGAKCGCSPGLTCSKATSKCCATNCNFNGCGYDDICNPGTPCGCQAGFSCQKGRCVPCTPCDYKSCGGPDDCHPGLTCGCSGTDTCGTSTTCCTANTCNGVCGPASDKCSGTGYRCLNGTTCCHLNCSSGKCGTNSDGCGGDCGCPHGFTCNNARGICLSDGTGTCGSGIISTCSIGAECVNVDSGGNPVPAHCCTPSCAGGCVGDDGCGGTCPSTSTTVTCPANTVCYKGACCTKTCAGFCSDDGCGGNTCADNGTCPADTPCFRGACCTPASSPSSMTPCGGSCTDDGCGTNSCPVTSATGCTASQNICLMGKCCQDTDPGSGFPPDCD